MTNLQNSNQTLHFWIIKTIKGGFLIGSDLCPAFILEDCDFIDYLLKVNEIGQDDWTEITYEDFLRGDDLDIQNHIDECLIEKKRLLIEEHNRSKLTAKNPPFPSANHPELHRACQRPTFSYHKIHTKSRY